MLNMPIRSVSDAFHDSWRLRWPFLLSHLVFTILAAAVLAPITTVALRAAIALSGQPALSDFDIALFLLSPVGFVGAIIVASLLLTVYVLDVAFMMAIALQVRRTGHRQFEAGIVRILPHAGRIVGFAWRLLARIVVIIAPFLLAGILVAQAMLTEFDINYYMTEKPPEAIKAAAIIGVVLLLMAALLTYMLLGWAVALPLVLFQGVSPRQSFRDSVEAMRGKRWDLFLTMLAWAAVSIAIIFVTLGSVGLLSNGIVGLVGGNLSRLAATLLLLTAVWAVLNLLVTTVTTGAFACLLMERANWPGTSGVTIDDAQNRKWLRRALWATMAGAAVMIAIGAFDLSSYRAQDKVQIIAHRGAAGLRPENTMAAFAKAIEDKADWVELDVQESAEGEIIVIHDSDFMKIAGVNLKAWDATAEALADIDIGSWYAPDYTDERTPTLRQVLELAKGTESGVLIELKYYGHDVNLEQRVADVVAETGMEDHVQVMSLKYPAVQKMKALRPDWTVGLLAATSVGALWDLEADFLAVNMEMASHHLVRASRAAGKDVHVWTVNDPLAMSEMMSLGVGGLITDEPARARQVLEERAKLTSVERLVLALGSRLGLKVSNKVYRDGSP